MNVINSKSIIKVAHRGVPSLMPENTMSSFKHAIAMNIDVLEIDLHLSSDGELVVIHDHTLDRTSNHRGKVGDFTFDELQQVDVGVWKGSTYEGERIPRFKDVLNLIKRTNLKLLIEIKKPHLYPQIEEKVLNEISESRIDESQCIIQSFDLNCVKKLYTLNRNIELGILLRKKDRFIFKRRIKSFSQYVHYVNPHYKNVNPRLIRNVHKENMKILPYTVNDEKAMRSLIKIGVDGIITDYPQILETII